MLRPIPCPADLASSVLVDDYDDLFALPGLTDFRGCVQMAHDVLALRSLNFLPLAQGENVTAQLFVDGRLCRSWGTPVRAVWRPDRLVREVDVDGLRITTTTTIAVGEPAVLVRVRVHGERGRTVRLGLSISSAVRASTPPWIAHLPPTAPNHLDWRDDVVVGWPDDRSAVCAQAVSVARATFTQGPPVGRRAYLHDSAGREEEPETYALGHLAFALTLDETGTAAFDYVNAAGTDEAAAVGLARRVLAAPDAVEDGFRTLWERALANAFDPDSDEYGGALPVLETTSPALRTLYWWGISSIIFFRRELPGAMFRRGYDTVAPARWPTTTFVWDYALSSLIHAMLDPGVMREYLLHWVDLDTHRHFGSEYVTGAPAGRWYAANDYSMTRLVRDYVAVTGDHGLLDEFAGTGERRQTMRAHLRDWATAWEQLRTPSGLADYGGIDNLMECVSSYVHEIAALNGANVWCMRVAADIAERAGDGDDAAALRAAADELAALVLTRYVDGEGVWRAGQPDGTSVVVRHCFDVATLGDLLAEDLGPRRCAEIVAFARRELCTPNWMRALSPCDPNAAFSRRTDHQYNGAYPAWPADTAKAFFRMGHADEANAWLEGLARSANQGPCGQAHFVDESRASVDGGARKAPEIDPYMLDWANSAAGAWFSLIVEGVFGVRIELDGTVTATPQLGLDPQARLVGLRVAGQVWDVDASGAHRRGEAGHGAPG